MAESQFEAAILEFIAAAQALDRQIMEFGTVVASETYARFQIALIAVETEFKQPEE